MHRVDELLDLQAGVIARRQALAAGMQPHDLRRLVRRREWVAVHPGVYVDHTGGLTWQQQAWAAVLHAWPAALCDVSALRADDGAGRRPPAEGHREHVDGHSGAPLIHVAVDRKRTLARRPGVRVHPVSELQRKASWNRSPPRFRVEEAMLDVASAASSDFRAIAALADGLRGRRTTADRLLTALALRRRIPRRRFLESVLDDLAAGTCSVLEHGYLTLVERPHGLPRAGRQVRASVRGPIYRDVVYQGVGLVVELDGRLHHDSARARDADLDRDLEASVEGLDTRRLGWGQVFDRPCWTAARLATLLTRRGWRGVPLRCPSCPDDAVGTPVPWIRAIR